MASKGDINKNEVQPVLSKKWDLVDFEKSLRKSGSFTKLKSNQFHNKGIYPIVDQGESKHSGYVNDPELLYKGDIPVVIFGDHTRNIKYIDFQFGVGADGTKILTPINELIPKFFYYYLRSLKIPSFGYSRHFKVLKEIDVPLPPLPEQERIVAKLDTLFAHLEQTKKRLEQIPVLLKQFRQAVLTQAVTGKLTEEWREGKELEEWILTDIGSLFEVKTGSTPNRGNTDYYENGNIPWLKSGQVKNELIFEADEFITEKAVIETNAKIYPKETLLVAMYGEGKTRGQVGWMKFEAASNQAVAALVNEEMQEHTRAYVFYFCLSQYNEIRKQAEGGNQPNLNLSKIKSWKINLPEEKEQTEIVQRVENLFAKADALEARYKVLKELVDKLPQALLAKAFRGEV